MADVTGVIGNQHVELNNAATEATLRLLLQATLSANRQSLAAIQNLARQSGIGGGSAGPGSAGALGSTANTVSRTNSAFFNAGVVVRRTSGILQEFINNTAETSSVLKAMSSIGGPLGGIFSALSLVAAYQEKNLKTYQQISTVGANFAGSLTDMRLAATNAYMTLADFGSLITSNAQTLAKMGSSVDGGARAFAALSKSLLGGETGRNLLALGYTTKDVNQGMLNYIAATGGRTSAELKNAASTRQLTESAAAYLENLDGLARLTGKTREAQQKELDEAAKSAAWQLKLQTMDEKSREKAMIGLQNALAVGGKGAADAFQSEVMGIAPDKAGQMFIATAGQTAEAVRKSAAMVTDTGKDSKAMRSTLRDALRASAKDIDQYSNQSLAAIIRQGGPTAEALQQLGITATNVKGKTDAEIDAILDKVDLSRTEAGMMADANANLKDFSQALIGIINPIVSALTPAIHLVSKMFSSVGNRVTAALKEFDKLGEGTSDLVKTVASSVLLLAAGLSAGKLLGIFGGDRGANRAGGGSRGAGRAGGSAAGGAISGVLGGLGRGLGAGIGGLLRGVAGGLQAFASPAVLLGVAGFSAAILAIGAAIAGASWLTGKALPTLAEGLGKIQELNGDNLLNVAKGTGAFGLSLLAFVPAAVFLVPAALGVNMLADGLLKMNTVDTNQLLKLAEAMERVNAATPSVGQTLKSGFSNIVGKITGAATEAVTAQTTSAAESNSGIVVELQKLNAATGELLRSVRESAEYSRRNLDATRALSGNLFPTK